MTGARNQVIQCPIQFRTLSASAIVRPRRLLTGVDVRVLLHVALLVESLATVGTRIRPRVAMDEQMCGQRAGALERFAALLAFEHFLHVVDGPGESERKIAVAYVREELSFEDSVSMHFSRIISI